MISVDQYFRSHQTLKNAKNIFQKTFYAETNEA
jgi:SUMO ligase MMS21 Smc5/6 complex component